MSSLLSLLPFLLFSLPSSLSLLLSKFLLFYQGFPLFFSFVDYLFIPLDHFDVERLDLFVVIDDLMPRLFLYFYV